MNYYSVWYVHNTGYNHTKPVLVKGVYCITYHTGLREVDINQRNVWLEFMELLELIPQ